MKPIKQYGLIFNQHKIENTVLPQFDRDNIEKICDLW